MNVIINQSRRFLTKSNADVDFTVKLVARLCRQHPGHQFFYLSYDKYISTTPLPANARKISISVPVIALPIKMTWYGYKLKKLVKQYKIDAVIHIDDYFSVTNAKNWLLLREWSSKSERLKSLTGIITPSFAIKNMLTKEDIEPARIKIMHCLPGDFYKPVDWDTREYVKQQFAEGREYLLFNAADTGYTYFLNMLKGFSTIKKWLKTGTKLIIVNAPPIKNIENLLNTYKYKHDITMLNASDNVQYPELLAASFAFIYMPRSQKDETPLLEAMQCRIPVITRQNDFFREICNEGAMYINPDNEDDIGEKLMKICKDEKTRALLAQNGISQLEILKNSNDASVFG